MQEDYLHFLWKYQKWNDFSLYTTKGVSVNVIHTGSHNFLSGPDFFNSRLIIGEQEWAGNVEIHIKASDWYRHSHHEDPAYDNVILHVVWEHDADIYRKNDTVIPVLELKSLIQKDSVARYHELLRKGEKWINCEHAFPFLDEFTVNSWLERLYVERLEQKSVLINEVLDKAAGNWEEVLFKMLAKYFGLNINGDAFLSIATSVPFSVVRKSMGDRGDFEALLFGQAGLLENEHQELYFKELQQKYLFLQRKFKLQKAEIPVKYFRLRPDNFPEIRLSQLAGLYNGRSALFSEVIQAEDLEALRELLRTETSEFWRTHYTFAKAHGERKKPVSKAFIDLLLINTIIPLKFMYFKRTGAVEKEEDLLDIIRALKAEANAVVNRFNSLRPNTCESALHSQALLQLKKEYCDVKRCLHCSLGIKILKEPA